MASASGAREGFGPDSVLLGQPPHLFERRDLAVEQVTGQVRFSPSQLWRWVELMAARQAWCAAHGMRFVALITPEKHVVYADMLPEGIQVSPQRPALQLLAALEPELRSRVVYPVDELVAARADFETYYQTDTHWTSFGAYQAYLAVIARLQTAEGGELVPFNVLSRYVHRKVGDLGIRLTPERAETATRFGNFLAGATRKVFANMSFNVGQVDIFATDGGALGKAVMFRDSSGSELLPFLTGHFRRFVAVASHSMFRDVLEAERPDVVFTQISERVLCDGRDNGLWLPDDAPQGGFSAVTRVSLPLPGASDIVP